MKIFYHDDSDGIMSAAILDYYFAKAGKVADMIAKQHPETILPEEIDDGEEVYIVDYSVNVDAFRLLKEKTLKLFWIDHHKSAIDAVEGVVDLDGLRSIDRAGAWLTWEFCFPGEPVPEAVKYVDDYDRHARQFLETRNFQRGFLLKTGLVPTNSGYFKQLFEGGDDELQQTIEIGNILEANADMWRRKASGYKLRFEDLDFLVMNKPGNSSAFRYIDDGTVDALMTWDFNGERFKYNLYRAKKGEKGKIDLTKIAVKYGGGGHPGACGFTSDRFLADPRQ